MTGKVLSDESVFLVENWDTVQEVVEAEGRLRRELLQFLLSLEDDLAKCPWWDRGWVFHRWQDNQVYVTRREWVSPAGSALAIGIAEFAARRVFGNDDPPFLFVWTRDKQLAGKLAREFEKDPELLGEVDRSRSNWVVRLNVRKCLPEIVDGYFDALRGQLVEFVSFYVGKLRYLDRVIAGHLPGSHSTS